MTPAPPLPDPAELPHTALDPVDGETGADAPPYPHAPPPRSPSSPGAAPVPAAAAPEFTPRRALESGGMGDVSLASLTAAPGVWVALKRPAAVYRTHPFVRAQFDREAELVVALQQPHLARGVRKGEDAVGPWIALKYVSGPPEFGRADWPADLPPAPVSWYAAVSARGPFPERRVVEMGVRLSDALAVLHERHRHIHGDIGPRNVLLGPDAEPVLIDFGLARPLGSAPPESVPFRLRGGYFAAPEVQENLAHTDPRADVYSLGATLAYAATGRYGATATPDTIPAPLRGVLLRATAPDPAARYATAGELGAALRALLNPVAPPPGTGLRLLTPVPDRPTVPIRVTPIAPTPPVRVGHPPASGVIRISNPPQGEGRTD